MADFRTGSAEQEALLRQYHPEFFQILEAFESGRVVSLPVIDRAFRAGLYGSENLVSALKLVNAEIVQRTFAVS